MQSMKILLSIKNASKDKLQIEIQNQNDLCTW